MCTHPCAYNVTSKAVKCTANCEGLMGTMRIIDLLSNCFASQNNCATTAPSLDAPSKRYSETSVGVFTFA